MSKNIKVKLEESIEKDILRNLKRIRYMAIKKDLLIKVLQESKIEVFSMQQIQTLCQKVHLFEDYEPNCWYQLDSQLPFEMHTSTVFFKSVTTPDEPGLTVGINANNGTISVFDNPICNIDIISSIRRLKPDQIEEDIKKWVNIDTIVINKNILKNNKDYDLKNE